MKEYLEKLLKIFIETFKNLPENLEKEIETNRKKRELIDKVYKDNINNKE